jgi:hypothetical protein
MMVPHGMPSIARLLPGRRQVPGCSQASRDGLGESAAGFWTTGERSGYCMFFPSACDDG